MFELEGDLKNPNTAIYLFIWVVVEDVLPTSFLEEEKDRGILGDLGGGRMEKWEALDRFNLKNTTESG